MGSKNVMLATLLSLLLSPPLWAIPNSITLEEALQKKLVTATITGKGSYYGQSIVLELKSNSRDNLNITLEAGRRLNCVYDSIQDMLITKSEIMALLPLEKKKLTIYAMCCEKTDHTPGSTSVFNLGAMAQSQLVKLAVLIESLKAQDMAGQSAVWVITNGSDTSSINSMDPNITRQLRDYVKNAGKIKTVSTRNPNILYDYSYPQLNGEVYTFEGDFEWDMASTNYVSLYLYDNNGQQIKPIFQDMMFVSGLQSYHYKLSDPLFETGEIYWIRLKQNGRTVKEVAISAE